MPHMISIYHMILDPKKTNHIIFSHEYYNLTKFHQIPMKNKKKLSIGHFYVDTSIQFSQNQLP